MKAKAVDGLDYARITKAVYDAVAKAPEKELIAVWKVVHYLIYEFTSYIVDGYLVSYAVHTPWFGTKPVLSECIILKLEEGGSLKSALDYLEQEAKELGCERVVVGTFLAKSNRALSRLYQRYGYKVSLHQLTKEIS